MTSCVTDAEESSCMAMMLIDERMIFERRVEDKFMTLLIKSSECDCTIDILARRMMLTTPDH